MLPESSQITSGGFGRVERVDLGDGTTVAKKTFAPSPEVLSASSREKLLKRFTREVKIQKALNSEFFVPILEFDLTDDTPWFTMPLAASNFETEIVNSKIKREVPLQGITDLLNALETLHSLGYVHRDIKPQNLLFHDNRWKLADFGLITPDTNNYAVTSANSGWGSARYQAPEQVSGFSTVNHQADIYSFGCVLHDIFGSGVRVPFQRQTCVGPVGPIIEKCTEIDPKKRFKSVTTLRGALLVILAQPISVQTSASASEWISKLDTLETWTPEDISQFIHFMQVEAQLEDKAAILTATDEERLETFHSKDPDLWLCIVQEYCEWAKGVFPFDYCDVIIKRLELIFEKGDFSTKAAAAISAAELGCSHNRWFVMQRLGSMCGPHIDSKLAERISIEIAVEEAVSNFSRSSTVIGETVHRYHPSIASIL